MRKRYLIGASLGLLLIVIAWISFERLGRKETIYRYPSGSIKLKEQRVRGDLRLSTWYLPNGEVFRETRWIKGTGTDYYLDDMGRMKAEIPHANGLANGVGIRIEYGERGAMVSFPRYSDGVEVSSDSATQPTEAEETG